MVVEREDVVTYRKEIFLATMEGYESCTLYHLEESGLVWVPPPTLNIAWIAWILAGKEVVVYFHDECCFHANDEVIGLWLVQLEVWWSPLWQFSIKLMSWFMTQWQGLKEEQPLRKPENLKSRGRLVHISDFTNEANGRLVERGNVQSSAHASLPPRRPDAFRPLRRIIKAAEEPNHPNSGWDWHSGALTILRPCGNRTSTIW